MTPSRHAHLGRHVKTLLATGKPDLAAALLRRLLAEKDPDRELSRLAGDAFLALGQAEDALACFAALLEATPDDPEALEGLGLACLATGRFEQAATAFRAALRSDPASPSLPGDLAAALVKAGRADEAQTRLEALLATRPDNARAWRVLGRLRHDAADHAAALTALERCLALDPADTEARRLLAATHWRLGRPEAARDIYQELLADAAPDVETLLNLAGAHLALDEPDRAALAARRAIEFNPDAAPAFTRLGDALAALGDPEADAAYRRAIDLDPADAAAMTNYAAFLGARFEKAAALTWLDRAVALDPGLVAAHRSRATILREFGRQAEALAACDAASALEPDDFSTRLCRVLATIPLLYETQEVIATTRGDYLARLGDLDAWHANDPAGRAALGEAIGRVQPFYLAYQGLCDREAQEIYGRLACRHQARLFPHAPPPRRVRSGADRIRVGFVSAFFHRHSNWKIPLGGWLRHLSRRRFEVHGFHVGAARDDITRTAASLCQAFVHEPVSWRRMAGRIRDAAPDVLVYPEVGMHPLTAKLACLRLAPVQCASWGHPDTTGLPTMDYYLTSALMEPEGFAAHYSETAVALPGLSFVWEPAAEAPDAATRADFGLSADDVVYLCAQSLPKYLPRHDDVFPRIAREVPGSRFVFIEHVLSGELSRALKARLTRAFAAHGLDARDHVVFAPQMGLSRYLRLNELSDVMLDTPEWSGCNSILEALERGLPAVSLPGSLMRGRHGFAILSAMDLGELIARDKDEYVRKAVALGRDPSLRGALSGRVRAGVAALKADMRPIRGLEEFLLSVAG